MGAPFVPLGQAVFGTVFKFSPKPWARVKDAAPGLQNQIDLLNRTSHPHPYRKPFIRVAPDGSVLLAIENVAVSQAAADEGSLRWAWQIARQAGLSQQEWDIEVVAADLVAR